VPFEGFVDIAPHFGGEIPQNPNFWSMNRRFQAKTGKILKVSHYGNYCIDFNQILHNDRDHQSSHCGRSQYAPNIQDGGRPPLNNIKLPYLCSRLTDFYEIWQGDAYWLLSANQPLKFRIFKIQDGGGRHLKNHKNCDISATVRLIFTKSGTVVQNGSLNCSDH